MILNYGKKLLVALLLLVQKVNLQMSLPMFMPPMPPMYYPPPPPPPMAMPVAMPPPPPIAFQIFQIQEPKKAPTTEKNEKEEKTIGIAIPMGFPAPLQFAIPPPMPPPFPPPMPLQNSEASQVRADMMGSQPDYQVISPRGSHTQQRAWRDKNYDHAEFQDYSSEMAFKKTNKRKRSGRGHKKSVFRKNFDFDMNYDDFAKPVLSYISKNGDIKLEKQLSDDEAAELMGDEQMDQNVQITAGEDSDNRQTIKVISSVENRLTGNRDFRSGRPDYHRRRQVHMRHGSVQHLLGQGKKELVFKPPLNKKISNLSVSFQIT